MKKRPAQSLKKYTSSNKWLIPAISGGIMLLLVSLAIFLKKPDNFPTSTPDGNQALTALPSENIALPQPDLKSSTSLESALKNRRTRRSFLDQSLNLKQVSQMLWSAQGVTVDWGGRTTPSAKSTYPLSVYLVANKVEGLDAGEYLYIPGDRTPVHQLKTIKKGDLGQAIFTALNQNSFKDIPAIVIITGNMGKMAQAFGGIAQDKDVYLESGHAAQNMYLQSESLKIGMVTNSSFSENIIRNIVTIPEEETLIYMIPFGHPKD